MSPRYPRARTIERGRPSRVPPVSGQDHVVEEAVALVSSGECVPQKPVRKLVILTRGELPQRPLLESAETVPIVADEKARIGLLDHDAPQDLEEDEPVDRAEREVAGGPGDPKIIDALANLRSAHRSSPFLGSTISGDVAVFGDANCAAAARTDERLSALGRNRSARGALAVEEDPLPQLEVDQQPKLVAVVRPAFSVLVRQPLDGARLKVSPRQRPRREHPFLHQRPLRPAQPAADGHRETHLPPGEDRAWQEIGERGPEHRLGLPAPQLEPRRDCHHVLDELVIEKRYPAL